MTSVFLSLDKKIQDLLISRDIKKPTEPQIMAIKPILDGKNVLLIAPTGLGKTEAAILPIFHGFGLGVCVNAIFIGGGKSILVPSFTPDQVADLIENKKPNLIFGVPTLYEALNRNPKFQTTDLSFLKAAFCGADTLPRTTKEKFEEICRKNGSNVQLREGYGSIE